MQVQVALVIVDVLSVVAGIYQCAWSSALAKHINDACQKVVGKPYGVVVCVDQYVAAVGCGLDHVVGMKVALVVLVAVRVSAMAAVAVQDNELVGIFPVKCQCLADIGQEQRVLGVSADFVPQEYGSVCLLGKVIVERVVAWLVADESRMIACLAECCQESFGMV